MAGFVQIIEFKTSRIEEVEALGEAFKKAREATGGSQMPAKGTITEDRDRPGTYLNIVEFPSHQAAMANSELPETQEFSQKMTELCDGPPKFYNLDVTQTWET